MSTALAAGEVKLASIADPNQTSDTPGGESTLSSRSQNQTTPDGRFVVFESLAGNLVEGDNNGVKDVFVYDRLNGQVTLVSVDASGSFSGNGLSRDPVISHNGRFVAFVSEASNLVPGGIDANDGTDVYVRDLLAQTTSLVSINAAGTASGNAASDFPSISNDGRYVAFESLASNLDAAIAGNNGAKDVFLRDRLNGSTVTCSTSTVAGAAAAGNSTDAHISGDGSRVVFFSEASNIVAGVDTNSSRDVYSYAVGTGTKQLVSAINGSASNSREGTSSGLHVSSDGRYVTFVTKMSLTATASDDSGGLDDIYRRDMTGTVTLLVTHVPASPTVSGGSKISAFQVTPSGSHVVFSSLGQSLDTSVSYPDTGANIFRAVLTTGSSVVSLVSATNTEAADGGCEEPTVSDDGRYVAFSSFATNLAPGNLLSQQAMLRDMNAVGAFSLVSVRPDVATSGTGGARQATICGDGTHVAFTSGSRNLAAGVNDINASDDVFLRDLGAGVTTLISTRDPALQSVTGGSGSLLSSNTRLQSASADGRYVVFKSSATNLVASPAKGTAFEDIYLRDTVLGTTEVISVNAAGTQMGNNSSSEPRISADGRYVAFNSFATNLVASPPVASGIHVYVRDRALNVTKLVTINAAGGASSGAHALIAISQDGNRVLFSSPAGDFTATGVDTNGVDDLFVRDIAAQTTTLVSATPAGTSGNSAATQAQMNDDGTFVVFSSLATNLVAGATDANGALDVFVRDLTAGTTVLASATAASATVAGNGTSQLPQISGNGNVVAFTSSALNLFVDPIPATTPAVLNRIYVRNLQTGTTQLATRKPNTDYAESTCFLLHIDRTGSRVLFTSAGTDMVAAPDANGGLDLFVFESATSQVSLVSVNSGGTAAAANPVSAFVSYRQAMLSPDGRWAVFISDASNMVTPGVDVNGSADLFARDLVAGITGAVSLSKNGVNTGNKDVFNAALSSAGNMVLFTGEGNNHVEGDFNGAFDVFTFALDNLPTFTPLPPVSVLEDAQPTTLDLAQFFSDVETPNLAYSVAGNSNAALFSTVEVVAPSQLKLTYAADTFGTADLTIRATDNAGLFVDAVVNVNVASVNDAPSFTKGADIATAETAVANTIPGWASNLSFGPANESSQGVSAFEVSADLPQLFAVQPAVAANGTLSFTPAGNLNGVAAVSVSVRLKDNGGTANGGTDTSGEKTFLINLTPVADTLIVLNRNDSGANSLRDCLNRARKGDTVLFDAVVFDPANSDAATVIDLLSELPPLDDGGVAIDASDRRVTLNGGAAGSSSGLVVSSSANSIRGLNIIAFNRTGLLLQGSAANNTIGGSRLSGAGPNGQGLRISGNGSAGVDLKGPAVAGNVVKGCWIGLDAAGTGAQPNLAGVLIQGGAHGNTIGGIDPGEANVVSGNQFEGVTASDEGSDDNIVIANVVGASGVAISTGALSRVQSRDADDLPNRTAVANGGAGVFLSKGTKGTMIGGETTASGNAIAFNGGNGVEVRESKTRRNSVRANRIKKNKAGIVLIEGANAGLAGPVSEAFAVSASPVANKVKVSARGSAAGDDGVVEIFSDDGEQGETFITRCAVSGGRWEANFEALNSKKVTATFTDAAGNTSGFVLVGDGASGGGSGPNSDTDSDGDGFSDDLESALGTSPTDPASTPLEGAPAGAILPLTLKAIGIKLNFAKPNADSIKIMGTLPAPDSFVLAGAKVAVSVGGAGKNFTLDLKGAGVSGASKLKLTPPKLGFTKFAATFALESFANALADENLTATTTVSKESRSVNVVLIFNGAVYKVERALIYSAKQGKSGSAK